MALLNGQSPSCVGGISRRLISLGLLFGPLGAARIIALAGNDYAHYIPWIRPWGVEAADIEPVPTKELPRFVDVVRAIEPSGRIAPILKKESCAMRFTVTDSLDADNTEGLVGGREF